MPQQLIDLSHKRFGKWLVLERGPNSKTRRARWLCRCSCGVVKLVQSSHLRRGLSTQCRGCAQYKGHQDISLSYWNHLINGAKARDYTFDITTEEAWSQFLQQESKCILTGEVLIFARNYSTDLQTASLDRIDSSKGYVVDNIQWVHKDVNMLKGSIDVQKFVHLCRLVACYQDGKLSESVTSK